MNSAICRIGVFYDGSYFSGAQNFFYINNYGWMQLHPFHNLIEQFIRKQEQNFANHKVVYSLEKDREFQVLFKGLFRQPEPPSPQPALIPR